MADGARRRVVLREGVGSLLASFVATAVEAGVAGVVWCAMHRYAGPGVAR